MTNKKFWLEMLAGLLTFGLVLTGCDIGGDDGDGENTDPKIIIITELTGKSGKVSITVLSTVSGGEYSVAGEGTISGDTVAVSLKKGESGWTGNGSYYLMLEVNKPSGTVDISTPTARYSCST